MILISHRGNLDGPNKKYENQPNYVLRALSFGYNVEVDVWYLNSTWYLGHDGPEYKTTLSFLKNYGIWCHAKNLDALNLMIEDTNIHCFWHENDAATITSRGYIWTYPGQHIVKNSINVLPETQSFNYLNAQCKGVCTDYIKTVEHKIIIL